MEKPKKNFVYVDRIEGNYDLLHPEDRSAQYIFRFPHLTIENINELDLQISYLISLDKDGNFDEGYTALEAAYEIKDIIDSYWLHSDKSKIDRLVNYLETIEEEQESLRHLYDINYAKYKINHWQHKLEMLQR